MKRLKGQILVILMAQTIAIGDILAGQSFNPSTQFTTPTFEHKTFEHITFNNSLSQNTANTAIDSQNRPATLQNGLSNIQTQNLDFNSRSLGIENATSQFGTQNSDFSNMSLKFEQPTFQHLNFNPNE